MGRRVTTSEIDMDEAELLHLAMADYMLNTPTANPPRWLDAGYRGLEDLSHTELAARLRRSAAAFWRRTNISGSWDKRLPLYLWIAVKPR